jgi:hypothetical protein
VENALRAMGWGQKVQPSREDRVRSMDRRADMRVGDTTCFP